MWSPRQGTSVASRSATASATPAPGGPTSPGRAASKGPSPWLRLVAIAPHRGLTACLVSVRPTCGSGSGPVANGRCQHVLLVPLGGRVNVSRHVFLEKGTHSQRRCLNLLLQNGVPNTGDYCVASAER